LGHVQVDVLSCANPGNLDTALSKWLPVAKARVFNYALPAADKDILGSAISPTNSPSLLLVYVCISVAGAFYVRRTVGASHVSEYLNSYVNLVAGAAYMFTVPWRTGDSINFRYSATSGTIYYLDAQEVLQ